MLQKSIIYSIYIHFHINKRLKTILNNQSLNKLLTNKISKPEIMRNPFDHLA